MPATHRHALGAILNELLALRPDLQRGGPQELLRQIEHEQLVPWREIDRADLS